MFYGGIKENVYEKNKALFREFLDDEGGDGGAGGKRAFVC